jgi:hypothetical protein
MEETSWAMLTGYGKEGINQISLWSPHFPEPCGEFEDADADGEDDESET